MPSPTMRFLFPLFVMWSIFSKWGVYGQLTSTTAATRPASVTSVTSVSPTATSLSPSSTAPLATVSFAPIPTLTACQSYDIKYAVTGDDIPSYNISIIVLGTTGNTTTTSSSSAAAASTSAASAIISAQPSERIAFVDLQRRDDIERPITVQNASATSYAYLVNLPFGRYYLHGNVGNPVVTGANSVVFWVVEGDDMSCFDTAASSSASRASSTASNRPSATLTSASTSPSTTAAGGNAELDAKSGVSGGTIAGVIIGVLAGIVALALLWFFCCYRKRRRHEEDGYPHIGQPEMQTTRSSSIIDHLTHAGALVGVGRSRRDLRHGEAGQSTSNGRHIALTSLGSAEGHEKDEGPFAGSPESEDPTTHHLAGYGNGLSPSTPRHDPFATAPSTPQIGDTTIFPNTKGESTMASRDTRRKSQPVQSAATTSERNRSNSNPSGGPSGQVANVKRTVSARRKPVPSLGAELRQELKNERSQGQMRESARKQEGERKEVLRSSFQLMPDPPRANNQ